MNKLKAIFITHIHGDHCYGLPGLLASAAMAGRKDSLMIIGPPEVFEFINTIKSVTELYLPYELLYINAKNLDQELIGAFKVSSVKLSHRVPTFAYSFELKSITNKLDVAKLKEVGIPSAPYWGQLQLGENINIKGVLHQASDYSEAIESSKKIIICGDNDQPSRLKDESINADVIVHEATYTYEASLKIGSKPMHCSALKISEFAKTIGLKNLVLTHFSPRYQADESATNNIGEIKEEANSVFNGNLFIANDFDVFQLDKKKTLTMQS